MPQHDLKKAGNGGIDSATFPALWFGPSPLKANSREANPGCSSDSVVRCNGSDGTTHPVTEGGCYASK
jgi:hypothetical protein